MKICNNCRNNEVCTYNKENLHDLCNIESNKVDPSRCAIIHQIAHYRKNLSLFRCLLRQYQMRDNDSLLIFLSVNTKINTKLAYSNESFTRNYFTFTMIRSTFLKEIRDSIRIEIFPRFRKAVASLQILFVTLNRNAIFVIFINSYSLYQTIHLKVRRV